MTTDDLDQAVIRRNLGRYLRSAKKTIDSEMLGLSDDAHVVIQVCCHDVEMTGNDFEVRLNELLDTIEAPVL